MFHSLLNCTTVIDIEDESQDEGQEVSGQVVCPICNAKLNLSNADAHVNAHFETPMRSQEPETKRMRFTMKDFSKKSSKGHTSQEHDAIIHTSASSSTGCSAMRSSDCEKLHCLSVADSYRIDFLLDCPQQSGAKESWLEGIVSPPWTAVSMSRKKALDELQRANPLWEHIGACTPQGFYAMMLERELIRIRRCELMWSREWWTVHWVFQRVRLTNVKRWRDKSSLVLASVAQSLRNKWSDLKGTGNALALSGEQKQLACDIICTVALWRMYGTPLAIETLGPQATCDLDLIQYDSMAKKLVLAAQKKFSSLSRCERGNAEYCFTRAYNPPRGFADQELQHLTSGATQQLEQLYVHASRPVSKLSDNCHKLSDVVARGPREFTTTLMTCPGYGGTGFLAKEITEDCKILSLFDAATLDKDKSWAMPGPGARRGMNRLHGRRLKHGMSAKADQFQKEMRTLWEARIDFWPYVTAPAGSREDIKIFSALRAYEDLECNDIQFQLCEADKFWRALELAVNDVAQSLLCMKKHGLRVFEPASRE